MINQEKEFTLSKKREELSKYLREQGLSVNICGDILRVVTNQDREFIKKLIEDLDWIKIKDGSGAWSPGQVKFIIEERAGKELI